MSQPQPSTPRFPTIAGLVPVTAIVTREVVSVRPDMPVEQVIDLVVDNYLGCLPVVDEDGCPVGMITKRDLVEPLASHVQPGKPPATAAEIMLPIVLSLDEHATVLQAAAMMARQGTHHVVIVSPKGRLVGVISSLDIVRWLAFNDAVADDTAEA
jgi:CBS domain-containing protein